MGRVPLMLVTNASFVLSYINRLKEPVLDVHGMLHHILLVVDRHICLLVRNVETVVMRQDIGVIV